jgi:thioredoxin reductase (NADPH)
MNRSFFSIIFLFTVMLSGCFEHKGCCDHDDLPSAATLLKQDASIKPVVIVGGGVAGLTAANYLLQANIACMVLEGPKPGGALAQSDSVRNWPGVFNAPGVEITRALKDQVVRNGGVVKAGSLTAIDSKQWPFVLTLQDETGVTQTIKTFSCIIAMGAEPNYLGIPGETGKDGYWGRGVTNCAVCDGALFKDKVVAVVGGGDSAVLEAIYLAGLAKKVYVLMRRDVTRANDVRKVNTLKAMSKVSFMYNTEVTAVCGNSEVVTELEIINNKTKAVSKLPVDGLFLAIGSTPNTKLLQGQCQLDKAGYISLINGQESSVHGLFAAGDVCDPKTKQAVTASAMGCSAALQAKTFLEERGYESVQATVNVEPLVVAEKKVSVVLSSKDKHDNAWVPKITSLDHARELIDYAGNKLMVVDVYGEFCMPCRKMMPIVEELAQYYDQQVSFTKLDIASRAFDANDFSQLVKTERIMQVPTFLFIKSGKVLQRSLGSMSKVDFAKLIEEYK